jgi:hypothetical protein
MLLRRLYRAISRRDYDQLRALEPGLGLARYLWRNKELRPRQLLHDLRPPGASRSRPNSAPGSRPSHGYQTQQPTKLGGRQAFR